MVPRSDKRLCLTHPERTRELRKHLVDALRTLRMAKHPARSASSTRPEPDGLVARVARTACSLCRGSCCRGGGDHGYMDERTMARVRRARPELDAREVLRLYVGLVPGLSYEELLPLSWRTRLHAAPVYPVRHMQQLLLPRA